MNLAGMLDEATREHVRGWAIDPGAPGTPVSLLITIDDVLIARVLADRDRSDLRDAGIGDGRHGFSLDLKGLSPLDRHVIAVRREADAAHLPGSPSVIEPAVTFDAAFQAQCATLLADSADTEALRERLLFLTTQAELLLRRQAERLSRRDERLAQQQIKWRWQDTDRPIEGNRAEPLPPRALIIDEMIPQAAHDAGSNAILSHMASLRRLGFAVHFAAATMEQDATGALEAAGIACYHAPWHGSVEEVLRRENNSFDLVYLHRMTIADRYTALVRFHQPKARLVFSVADLHHLRLARQSQVDDRPELLALARRIQATELRACAAADAVLTHSTFEAALLREQIPKVQVHVVPWTVPSDPTNVPIAARHGLAFIGHYPHVPNLRAARFLVTDIMPALQATHPEITCLLVGSDMPPSLLDTPPCVEAIGQVANLSDIYDRVRLTVAPLTFGAGVKGKVLASLAAGIPCVCSPIAAEGLDLPPVLQSLVAADAAGLAASIIRLHEDVVLNQACRDAGLAYVDEMLSETRIDGLMREVSGIPANWRMLSHEDLSKV